MQNQNYEMSYDEYMDKKNWRTFINILAILFVATMAGAAADEFKMIDYSFIKKTKLNDYIFLITTHLLVIFSTWFLLRHKLKRELKKFKNEKEDFFNSCKQNSTEYFITENGYLARYKLSYYHREMAEQITGHHLGELCCHHIDQNKQNNEADNIAILTHEGHDFLHLWIKDKKKKEGTSPSRYEQVNMIRTLEGYLLSDFSERDSYQEFVNNLNHVTTVLNEMTPEETIHDHH